MPRSGEPAPAKAEVCELVCIPPDRVAMVWPRVSQLIYAAMKRGGISSFKSVEDSVLDGDALLWLAIADGNGIGSEVAAAAVTELHQTEWRKVCVIVACGGSTSACAGAGMNRWIALIAKIEEFARAENCSAIRIIGREGWARILTAYRPKRVVLEKELH